MTDTPVSAQVMLEQIIEAICQETLDPTHDAHARWVALAAPGMVRLDGTFSLPELEALVLGLQAVARPEAPTPAQLATRCIEALRATGLDAFRQRGPYDISGQVWPILVRTLRDYWPI